jgi:hypothetical protein
MVLDRWHEVAKSVDLTWMSSEATRLGPVERSGDITADTRRSVLPLGGEGGRALICRCATSFPASGRRVGVQEVSGGLDL